MNIQQILNGLKSWILKKFMTIVPSDISRSLSDASFVSANGDNLFYLRQATTQLAGLMTASDKTAVNNIITGMSRYLSYAVLINSDGDTIINIYCAENNGNIKRCGLMSYADKAKLDALFSNGELTVTGGASFADGKLIIDNTLGSLSTDGGIECDGIYSSSSILTELNMTVGGDLVIASDGVYQTKNNLEYPVAHPDISTVPRVLPQRFKLSSNGATTYDILEVYIPYSNIGQLPANSSILSAWVIGSSEVAPLHLGKQADGTWFCVNHEPGFSEQYVLVQYITAPISGTITQEDVSPPLGGTTTPSPSGPSGPSGTTTPSPSGPSETTTPEPYNTTLSI